MLQILSQTSVARPAAGGNTAAPVGVAVIADGGGGGRGGANFNIFGGGGGGGGLGGGGGPSSPITDATITLAQGVLSGPQVDALKQLQQEQLAQQKIGQAVRDTMGANNGGAPSGAPATTRKKGG